MTDKGMGILVIVLIMALILVSAFALTSQVELMNAHRVARIYKAAIEAESIADLEREMAMMDHPGIIIKVDFITGKDIDDDDVYIYTRFPWGEVKGKCSKEFFENVHNYRENREQMLKHLRSESELDIAKREITEVWDGNIPEIIPSE